ncbi:MAG: cation transporter, partial [Pseudomonadota bacterium]|nr:cation transporter [Pseudomonadota bacterium]
MNRYQYRVDAMHCQGCVKRMREAVQAEDAQAEVSGEPADHRLQVDSMLPRDRIAQLLTEAGYPPATEHGSHVFTIPAMSCQGCVKRMREAVQAEDAKAEVSGEPADHRLQVDSTLPRDRVAQLLTAAGYPPTDEAAAEPEARKSKSDRTDDPRPSDDAAPSDSQADETTEAGQLQRLSISGMTCAGCVNAVQKALSKTPGVQHAQVNFASETAQVSGQASIA